MNTSDKSTEELMFQYAQLRQEILAGGGITTQILAAATVVTGAAISIAFSNAVDANWAMGGLFFLAGLIAVAGLEDTLTRTRVTHMIASYLRMFVEPKTRTIRWETRLQEFRKNSPSSRLGFMPPQFWIYTGLILINALLCSGYIFLAFRAHSWLFAVLGVSFIMIVTGVVIKRAWVAVRELMSPDGGDIEKCWEEVKRKEDEEAQADKDKLS